MTRRHSPARSPSRSRHQVTRPVSAHDVTQKRSRGHCSRRSVPIFRWTAAWTAANFQQSSGPKVLTCQEFFVVFRDFSGQRSASGPSSGPTKTIDLSMLFLSWTAGTAQKGNFSMETLNFRLLDIILALIITVNGYTSIITHPTGKLSFYKRNVPIPAVQRSKIAKVNFTQSRSTHPPVVLFPLSG
jgi:hypothetical protein